MSLLAASAAAYNKELSLISHFILHLGFDPGDAKLEDLFLGLRCVVCLLKATWWEFRHPLWFMSYLKLLPSFFAKLQGHGLITFSAFSHWVKFLSLLFTVHFKLQRATLHFGSPTWQQDIILTVVITVKESSGDFNKLQTLWSNFIVLVAGQCWKWFNRKVSRFSHRW